MCKIYQGKYVVRRNNIAPDAISDVNKYNIVYNNRRSNKKLPTYIM